MKSNSGEMKSIKKSNENNNFHKYLWYVVIFSFIGLLIEYLYGFIITKKGFTLGPLSILYGLGALTNIVLLNNLKGHKIKLFICGATISTTLQYIISFLFEGLLGATFWNCSDIKFNLNARVSVLNFVLWGLLTVIIIEFLQNLIDKMVDRKFNKIKKVIDILIIILIFLEVILVFWGIITYKIRMEETIAGKNYISNNNVIEIFQNKFFSNENIEKVFPNLKITIVSHE